MQQAAMASTVRDFLKLFHAEKINFDRVENNFSENAIYQPHVPGAEILTGKKAIRAELERQLSLYDSCDFQIINIAFNDHQVFTERRDYVTQNNVRVEVRVNAIFELDGHEKITSWREYWDMSSVQKQLDVSADEMAEYMEQG